MATVPPRTARPRTSKTRKRTVTESPIAVPEQPFVEAAVLTAASINKTFRDDERGQPMTCLRDPRSTHTSGPREL